MKNIAMSLIAALLAFSAALGQYPSAKHIVGGQDATFNEFPFVAKIIYSGSQIGCTGSLIAPDKVLTAGHCVSGYSNISVGFGNTRTLEPRHQVASSVVHPDVDANYWKNDVAILQLETSLPIRPVRLLTLEEELQYAPSGSLGVAVGWGSTHPSGGGGTSTRTLQKVTDIPIYTHEDCRQVLAELRSQGKKPGPPRIHEKILCAGEEGRAIGQGDSGGPLLVPDANWVGSGGGTLTGYTRSVTANNRLHGAVDSDILLCRLGIPYLLLELRPFRYRRGVEDGLGLAQSVAERGERHYRSVRYERDATDHRRADRFAGVGHDGVAVA